MNKRAWFTLVELIVVITILAILWAIAFLSLQWYSKSARDSTRLTDIKTIEKSLELFALQTWYYPEPSDSWKVTFSGAEVRTQWLVWDHIILQLQKLNKKPVDPLNGLEYVYSRLNTKKEVEIAAVFEQLEAFSTTYIIGNYNGLTAKVATWGMTYVLAVPTIVNGDIFGASYEDILINNTIVADGSELPPHNYNDPAGPAPWWNEDEWILNPIVFESPAGLPSNEDEVSDMMVTLQDVYGGATFSTDEINDIVNETDVDKLIETGIALVEYDLWWKVEKGNLSGGLVWSSWKDLDSNCEIDDIVLLNGQVWAGCNSTLWTGLEWGQLDSDIGSNTYGASVGCYDYEWNSGASNCSGWNSYMMSYHDPRVFYDSIRSDANLHGDKEFNTIWWKLYTWDQAMNGWACPSWWSLPTRQDWIDAQTELSLGWAGHTSAGESWSLASKFKVPLAWYRYPAFVNYSGTYYPPSYDVRWNLWALWTQTEVSGVATDAYSSKFEWSDTWREDWDIEKENALSVRCIKD